MRRFAWFASIALMGTSRPISAQKLPFPADTFFIREAIARRLLAYDTCAWQTSDELVKLPRAQLEGLTPHWICFQRGSIWHGLYGAWDSVGRKYTVRAHFELAQTGVRPSSVPLDTARVNQLIGSLALTSDEMPAAFTSTRARFNPYVLSESDSTISVWVLPAWQPDGTALFGAELHDRFTSDGRRRISRELISGPLRATRPDSSTPFRIDSNASDSPSVGDIFFLLLMRPYMPQIRIVTPRFSSSLMKVAGKDNWVHVVRDATRP